MTIKKWVGPLMALLAVLAGGAFLVAQMNEGQSTLKLSGDRHHITVLRTPDELQKGLSGSKSLPEGSAMVFVFPRDDNWGIWMKDMNYAIDIVWLDSGRKVVHMVKDAQPSTYPAVTFKPSVKSRYVIEFPSGTIERTGIRIGDIAGLPSGV